MKRLKLIKKGFIVSPLKYTVAFLAGLVFASTAVYAWSAVWHGTNWIQSGQTIHPREIGENMQYLYEKVTSVDIRTIPLQNIPTCSGSNKALQWNGSSFACATISTSGGGNSGSCSAQQVSGEYTSTYCDCYSCVTRTYQGKYNCPGAAQGQLVNCELILGYKTGSTGQFQCVNGQFTQKTTGGVGGGGGGGTCGSCFTSPTKITMADGSKKAISEIKKGDKVLGKGGVNTVQRIERVPLAGRKLYSINNSSYFVTAEHPFLTTNGWKSISPEATKRERASLAKQLNIKELKVGDKILTQNGTVTVKSIKGKSAKEQTVYNLILDGDKTYYADELLVHNKM